MPDHTTSIELGAVTFEAPAPSEPGGAPPQLAGDEGKRENLHEDWGLFSFFQISVCGKSCGPQRTKQLLVCLCVSVLALAVATVALLVVASAPPEPGDGAGGGPVAAGGMTGGVGQRVTCADHPCQNGGVCRTPLNHQGVLCDCSGTGFVGDRCEADHDSCYSMPCRHGGTCVDNGQAAGYRCTCPEGYAGDECEAEVDDCASRPCANRGLCIDLQAEYHCDCCGTGFTGENCEAPSEACPAASDSCDRDHSCCVWDAPAREGTCVCNPGWGGPDCGTESDMCNPSPCRNRGACIDLYNDWLCNCQRGFAGEDCGHDIDECGSSPCHEAGTLRCSDRIDSYRCHCREGWGGAEGRCEEDLDECANHPCLNGGVCDDSLTQAFISPGYYHCSCLASYFGAHYGGPNCELDIGCPGGRSGSDCAEDIDECASRPCRNGGRCLDSTTHGPVALGLYQCECTAGWFGPNCERDVNECDSSPCTNGGTCSERPGQVEYDCRCPLGFSGQNCDEDLHACDSNPCQNDGVCVSRVNAYRCLCGPQFDGENCERLLVNTRCTLSENPCQNGGVCRMEHNRAVCECRPGFSAEFCTTTDSAGIGSSVDISNLHTPDGSFKLNKRHIFTDEADAMVTRATLGALEESETQVYRTALEFMQDYSISLGISYVQGQFTQDNWVGGIRQHGFSARETKVYGVSEKRYEASVRTYAPNMPLHGSLAEAIELLPLRIQTEAQKADYLNLLDRYGTHYVRREILGGLLRNHFFVRESDYALYGDDVKARAREYFSSLVEGSIASAADNSMTYLTMRNDTRLTSLHFSASGGQTDFTCTNSSGGVTDAATEGQCQATPGNVWSSDLSSWMASVNADPALISIELAPLAELIADGTKRENMQAMTLAYLRTCTWSANSHHPICSNRGSCLASSGVCNCDPGFYPQELLTDVAPCSLFACPKRMQVECDGHGDCDSETGLCSCEPEWDGPDCHIDVDECQDVMNECAAADRACHNLPGGFECGDCIAGYAEDARGFCADFDECAADPSLCAGLECVNEVGSYRCGACEPGFTPNPADPSQCEDIDECAEANNECVALFEDLRPCVNQPGSYTCGPCVDGYRQTYNGFCEDIDECVVPERGAFCEWEETTFEWVDAQSLGVEGPPLNDDDDFEMPLPFKFAFYGTIQTTVHISSNGYIFLTGGTLAYGETAPIPSRSVPNNIISPYWTDLDPTSCGAVYTLHSAEQFVIEWVDVPYFNLAHTCRDTQHFEAILRRDGSITFQYNDISSNPNYWASPSIGVENEDGSAGLRVASCRGNCNAPVVSGGAVSLTPCLAEAGSTESMGDGRWSYPCPDHSTCINTLGNFECDCDEGFGTAACTPKVCTQSTIIPGSNRDESNPCSGTTGEVCEYRCLNGLMQFGEHVCGYGGAFFGGMCVSDCHTLQVDGDCFHSFNGLYSLVEDDNGPTLLNGQPQYTKHASRDPDPKHLYYQRNQ